MADKEAGGAMDLFAAADSSATGSTYGSARPFEPLARRMRPRNFKEFIGQQEAVGSGHFLRRMIEQDQIS